MIFQTITLSQDAIKSRWEEPYVTAGLNQKALASDVRGVVQGFRVFPQVGYTVEIRPEPVSGLSIANVIDSSGAKFSLTIIQNGSLFFDLTAQANSTVFIVLDAQYSTGSPSGAQVRVVDAAQLGISPDYVLIAKVVVPASPPVLATHINMGYRLSAGDSTPLEAGLPINLVQNGTFERDVLGSAPNGWAEFGAGLTPTVVNTTAHSGVQSMQLFAAAPLTDLVGTGPMAVEPGQLIRFSAWLRSDGINPITGGTGVTVLVSWSDGNYNSVSSLQIEDPFTGGGTTFVQRAAELTVPAGVANAQIIIRYGACSGRLFVDDVQFLVRSANNIAETPVFGGATSIADEFHAHAATGLNYAGSLPDTWADGTNLPASTVEDALDNIVIAVGGTSGAAKVGYTPTTPRDLGGVTRVDQALDTLDDQKASLNLTNTFTKTNTFTPSVANTSGIVANANGTSPAIQAVGATSNSGSAIVGTTPNTNTGPAILGFSAGSGAGIAGAAGALAVAIDGINTSTNIAVRGQSVGGIGVYGAALGTTNPGVSGLGFSSGPGVLGTGGASGPGVKGQGGATGIGGDFFAGASGIAGVRGTGGNTIGGGYGVYGVAGTNNGIGVRGDGGGGNYGIWGIGGPTNGTGVYGQGGTGNAVGVHGEATGAANGVEGHSPSGTGVRGSSGGSSSPGGSFQGGSNGPGVIGEGQGIGAGVEGFGNGAFSTPPNGTGVYGQGFQGVVGTSNASGAGADGVQGTAGPNGNGVSGFSNDTDTLNGAAGVYGEYNGGMQGFGVYGFAFSGAAGVKGESGDIGTPGGLFTGPGFGAIATGLVGLLAAGSPVAIRSGGYIDFTNSSGSAPPPNPLFNDSEYNRLTGKNVIKAWAQIRFDSQTPASARIIDGFNVSSVSRSGTTYFLNFVTSIGRPNLSGSTGSFSLSGITITFTAAVTPPFTAADIGRTVTIAGSTTPANDSPDGDSWVITGVPAGNQLQWLNAPGVTEAFPGTWSISETPYAVSFTLSDTPVGTSVAQIVRFTETTNTRVGFTIRDNTGAARNSGFDPGTGQGLRLTITVTGPQY